MKRKKNQLIARDPKVTKVIDFVDTDIKVVIINIFHMSKVEKCINILRRGTEVIKRPK